MVAKRYREFVAFDALLKESFPDLTLPNLPPKSLFSSLSSNTVDQRRSQLKAYMNDLIIKDDLRPVRTGSCSAPLLTPSLRSCILNSAVLCYLFFFSHGLDFASMRRPK